MDPLTKEGTMETTRKQLRTMLNARASTDKSRSMYPPSPTEKLVEEILEAVNNDSAKQHHSQSSAVSRSRRRPTKRTIGQCSRRKKSNATVAKECVAINFHTQDVTRTVDDAPLLNLDQLQTSPMIDPHCHPEVVLPLSLEQQTPLSTMTSSVNPVATTMAQAQPMQTVVPNDLTPNVYRVETMSYLTDLFDTFIAPTLASTSSPLSRTRFYKQLVLDLCRQALFTHSCVTVPDQAFNVFLDVVSKLGLFTPQ